MRSLRLPLFASVIVLFACNSYSKERDQCRQYIDCVTASEPSGAGAATIAYGDGSACWNSEANAKACATSCDDGLKTLRTQPNAPAVCRTASDGGMAGAVCTAPSAVTCTDQSVLKLNLFATVPNRTITNTAEGSGWLSEIDATGGATGGSITPRESFVYAKFSDAGLERVAISDEQAFDSMDWDIAFRRYVVRLNSGVSGPSCVSAARTATTTVFDDLAAVPEGLEYRTEQYMTASCDLISDGSGLEGSAAVAMGSWWTYPGCVSTTENVFVVRRADGRQLKLTIVDYYSPAVQDTCNSTGTINTMAPTGSGHFRVRWAWL